ncbi:MAG TPA: arginine deiminase-related protein, partial [Chitinophagaceae bacterium]|nr:arginine deiminase-related protein [Chitinophagaceae bacterium]
GSMVLDRENKIAYACLSKRTEKKLLEKFCQAFNYSHVAFIAVDKQQNPIYHTNVMMSVADKYVVICLDSIKDSFEKEKVITAIKNSGKEIIEISYDQMNHFAGNMLQVKNRNDKNLLVMSTQAFKNLDAEQIQKLQSFNRIIDADISTIETHGGGSARCMMAEIFLQPK